MEAVPVKKKKQALLKSVKSTTPSKKRKKPTATVAAAPAPTTTRPPTKNPILSTTVLPAESSTQGHKTILITTIATVQDPAGGLHAGHARVIMSPERMGMRRVDLWRQALSPVVTGLQDEFKGAGGVRPTVGWHFNMQHPEETIRESLARLNAPGGYDIYVLFGLVVLTK